MIGGTRPLERGRSVRIALLFSVTIHATLGMLAWRPWSFDRRVVDPAAKNPIEVFVEEATVPAAPEAPPPSSERPTPTVLKPREAGRARTSEPHTELAPAPPSAATKAPEPGSNVPVDLTDQALVTASANSYPGGATGLGQVRGGAALGRDRHSLSAPASGDGTGDRSGAISLENQNWACPWPAEADADRIDEQVVAIRVVVRADGTVESADVLSDPGHGFAQAATTCALRTRFTPARDREGRPVRAASPDILVRFTR